MELRAEEPRRAIVSLEMLLTGEWIVPHINGWTYYNKPPFFNWIMAFFFWLFQSFDEWVVRFPALLSACIHAWLIYSICKNYLRKEVAILAGLIYITAGEILFFGSITSGEIDLFFSLITFLQVYAIYKFNKNQSYLLLYTVSYSLAAIGLLTKGLPSVAFQGLTLVAWTIYTRNWKSFFSLYHVLGGFIFISLTGTYFYHFSLQDDVIGFLVRQYKEAAMRTGLETENTSTFKGVFLFIPGFLKLLLPWSLFLILSITQLKKVIKNNSFITFWLIFILVNIPIYWISGDFKARYYYVFMAAISVIIAELIYSGLENQVKLYWVLRRVLIGISFILPSAFLLCVFIDLPINVNNLNLRLIILFVLSLCAAVIFLKSKEWLFGFVVVLAVARVALNLLYLPAWQNDKSIAYYRQSADEMLEISQGNPIFFYGEPYVFSSDASFGPLKFKEVRLTTAPLMNYRIPYYLSRKTHSVMEFDEEMLDQQFYLTRKDMVDSSKLKILYRLHDNWQKQDYVLVNFTSSVSDLGNNTK